MKVRQNNPGSGNFCQILNCHLLFSDGRPSAALLVCEISPANMYMCVLHGHPATVISLSLIAVSPRHVFTSHPSTFPVHNNAVLWRGRYRIASLVAFLALFPHGNVSSRDWASVVPTVLVTATMQIQGPVDTTSGLPAIYKCERVGARSSVVSALRPQRSCMHTTNKRGRAMGK